MVDHPRRGRNRPDSRAMWDESDRHNNYDRGTRDRRDNRDRYRDNRPRSRDRRHRSRSRSPVNERRERHRSRSRDRRDRDRDHSKERRRGYESTRDKTDGRHSERDRDAGKIRDRDRDRERERERDGRRRDDGREDRGPGRRGNPRRSVSPRSPLGKVGRATHDNTYSPLPTRSKNRDTDSGPSSVRGELDDDNRSRKGNTGPDNREDAVDEDERRGRRSTRDNDSGGDAMDEDDDVAVEDDAISAMQAMMGFGGFGTTKNQKVAGNNTGAVYKAKKTEYRQYMNRVGGFNRPLSPGR